jgi:hypothetical protein
VLIDAAEVAVQFGRGVYPPRARWADPDLHQAAAAMRALALDEPLRLRLGAAGRERMLGQPTLLDTGRLVADLLGLRQPVRA